MADLKISQLATESPIVGTEEVEILTGGVNKKTTTQAIANLAGGGGHVIEDEGTPLTQRADLNFVGAGVAVTDAGGKTVVTIAGDGVAGHVIEEEGTPLTQRANMNFTGAGVAVTDAGGKTVVTISGSAGVAGHVIEDEGTPLTQRADLNFVGAGVTVTDAGGKTVVTIGGGSTTPGGSDTQVQYNDASAFGGEAAFTYNKTTNTLDVDKVTVDDDAYNATTWNGSLEVPTKNALRDKIETISPIDYTRQALTVSGSTTAMDFNSLTYRNFDITATQSAAFSITFSNATNIVESRLTLRITGTVAITLPSSVVMQQYETINGRWVTSTNILTLIGTTATPFMLTFYSDGTNVICSASDPTE